MRDTVEHVNMRETRRLLVLNDTFQFTANKKYHRTQRILFWILRKIGCYAQVQEISLESVRFDKKDFVERLHEMRRGILNLYREEGKYLLIGGEACHELTGYLASSKFSFSCQANFYKDNGRMEVVGLNIVVIPWMEGMLVVPDLGRESFRH